VWVLGDFYLLLPGLLRTATGRPSKIPSHEYASHKAFVTEINKNNLLVGFDVHLIVHHDKHSYNKTKWMH
jgi:hypothetical protein